jgi:hypothetical protein
MTAMPRDSPTALERLEALVGRWRTQGWTLDATGEQAERIDALDTYEWLPGGFGLLHRVDAHVGETSVEGAEIIGYDAAREAYVTQYVGSDGPAAYEATLEDEDGVLVWTMRGTTTRFTGNFSASGDTITGFWELRDEDSTWRRWMEITLVKLK